MDLDPIEKLNNPDLVTADSECPEFLIAESKCGFKIKNFESFLFRAAPSSTTVDILECGIQWKVFIRWRVMSSPHDVQLIIEFGVEIVLRSDAMLNKFQYRISGTSGSSKSIKLFDSDFKSIDQQRIFDRSNSCPQNRLMNSLESGSLFLAFKLEIKHPAYPIFGQRKNYRTTKKIEVIDQNLSLLNDSTFSDFAFVVKGRKIKVHKCILAGESEIMRAMFSSNLKESVQAECVVDHIEPDIFQHILRFIYAKIIPSDLDNIAVDLYKAAHYYRIEKLMEICEKSIHVSLSVSNAQEIYELSVLYDMKEVKLDAWQIVKCHILKIFFPLKDEPLPLKEFHEIIEMKNKEKEFWSKHEKSLIEK